MKKLVSYVLVFVLGFAACAYIIRRFDFQSESNNKAVLLHNLSVTPTEPVVRKGQNPIADAAAEVGPAVVSIYTNIERQVQSPLGGFFGFPPETEQGMGAGSGIIISSDGYILTNNHVVADAQKIRVKLKDGRDFDARVVGRDPLTEVAVVKINATHLPVAKLGNSNDIRVGDWAIAIGNPLGRFENTVTVGVISATGRDETVGETTHLVGLIQTDAAINPGNSGGALCNINGEVIGINTMIASTGGGMGAPAGNIGIGFAIPINSAKSIAKQLIEHGTVAHPYLGVGLRPLMGDDLTYYNEHGFQGNKGAMVAQLVPGSPAEKAGIQLRDIIIKIEGQKINDADSAVNVIRKYKVGQLIRLTVWRDGKITAIIAKLANMPMNMR